MAMVGFWVAACGGMSRGDGGYEPEAQAEGGAKATEPREIPFADRGCEAAQLAFEERSHGDECPPLDCGCPDTFPPLALSGGRGCVVSLDCDLACAPEGLITVFDCAINECENDDQCAEGSCFIPPGRELGWCGRTGYDCIERDDCLDGDVCVADSIGRRTCTSPTEFSSCNDGEQCPGMRCVREGTNVVGACSSGKVGSPCASSFDCDAGLSCPGRSCTDGKYESPCERDSDCDSRQCRARRCTEGREFDECVADRDCQSNICVYGAICTSGELDQPCEQNEDCLSSLCAGDASNSACTDGQVGSKCLEAADCQSASCRYDVEQRPGDHFGRCD
jgi:hypothetical protein